MVPTGCFKLVFTVLKKLLTTKTMRKMLSKSAIGRKTYAILITMLRIEHRAFVVECFIKTECYVAVQRAFCNKFKLRRHDLVPSGVAIS